MKIMPRDKKGGVVTSTIMGVGGLIIGLIIVLVIISTINNAKIIGTLTSETNSVTNESLIITGTGIKTLATSTAPHFVSWNASRILNGSVGGGSAMSNETLKEGTDYQIFSANGSIGNKTTWDLGRVRITYTYVTTDDSLEQSVGNLTTNFTSGVGNISAKIPTILLIVAVVFLFGALVLLIRNAKAMGMFGSGGQGSL